MLDDTFLPSYYGNYENNNPIESFFEELKTPSDMWNLNDDNGEDKLDEGLWSAPQQPHYEFPSRAARLQKRFKPRNRADDFKNYFNY
jgi:hypothetical protein